MSSVDLSEVANGALVSAIAVMGRWLAIAARKPRGRRAEDLSIARWFESYRLTDDLPELPGIPYVVEQRLIEVLPNDEVQVTLQELLAVRLTDAAEVYAAQAREAFVLTFSVIEQNVGPGSLAAYAQQLAGYYDDRICELVARLEGNEPTLLAQIRAEALSARMIAVLNAIERHTAALASGPAQNRTESEFLARYSRHVVDHHGMLQAPDFDRRRLVSIDDIYVSARIYEHPSPERAMLSPREQLPQLNVEDLAARIDRTVLLGDPGGGKTTTAKVLMCHFDLQSRRVPFLVTLRECPFTGVSDRTS